jgi:hypothetical protein
MTPCRSPVQYRNLRFVDGEQQGSIAAFGAGPLQEASVGLPALFTATAVLVITGGLSFVVTRRTAG